MKLPIRLTLASHAFSEGFDLSAFTDLDNGLHEELNEEVFRVLAVLRGAPDEYPLYLLDGLTVHAAVAVQACEPEPIAAGDLVMLPEEVGEERDDWFTLRRLITMQERNRLICLVGASLKPHLEAMGVFASELGLSEVTTGVEVDLGPAHSRVAAVAKAILDDGTQVDIRTEVSFDNLIGCPGYGGSIFARRQRSVKGEHIASTQRLAFIEAGLATSANPIHLFTALNIFGDVEDEGNLVYVMEALDLKSELAEVAIKELRLHERFD